MKDEPCSVSSHILAEVARTADTVVILAKGRLVVQSPLHELLHRTNQVVRIRTPQPQALVQALATLGASVKVIAADCAEVSGASPEAIGLLATERAIPIFETTIEAPALEEIFLKMISEKTGESTEDGQ